MSRLPETPVEVGGTIRTSRLVREMMWQVRWVSGEAHRTCFFVLSALTMRISLSSESSTVQAKKHPPAIGRVMARQDGYAESTEVAAQFGKGNSFVPQAGVFPG